MNLQRGARPGRRAACVTIVLITALVVLFFPVPSDQLTLSRLLRLPLLHAPAGGRQRVVIGNSVVDHVSRCDSDTRTLAEMVQDRAQMPIVDLSYGGQQLAETIDFAATALRTGAVSDVVLFLATFTFTNQPALDAHAQAFFRIAAGPFHGNDLWPRVATLQGFVTPPMVQQTPFTYGNAGYPDYGTIINQYFNVENEHEGCPEAGGYDDHFIEANYWNEYLRTGMHPEYVQDLQRLKQLADGHHARLHIVLMPIDYGDMQRRNPSQAASVAGSTRSLLAALHAADLDPLDLTSTQPAEIFSDRYCACGHLQQAGRLDVAARAAELLK